MRNLIDPMLRAGTTITPARDRCATCSTYGPGSRRVPPSAIVVRK
ncbi:hypothetical protein FTUN_7858 [Frigoriglobus tundricola]|uniref:Uncharacterized protein n=1 Tax=Frigoriglobus tundricola TaxID=2774151 RepID=A0A6M5Z436_9BACT|nr:hypothetical protein FTUN_7858 [Frigoriglobus tundricola]